MNNNTVPKSKSCEYFFWFKIANVFFNNIAISIVDIIDIIKPTFLSALELGALLSSYLEGALYKFLNE